MKNINCLINSFKQKTKILKDKNILFGLLFLTILSFCVLFRSKFFPDPYVSSGNETFQSYSPKHWMGTDATGYDIFSRVLEGSKISLQISFITIIISSFIGCLLGIIAGYFRGFFENIIIFICDFLTIFPDIILAILIMLCFKKQTTATLVIVLCVLYIPDYIRIIRVNTLTIKQKDFIKASKALGSNDIRIIQKHILPNLLSNLITKMILNMSNVILVISGFGFIGLGLNRTKAEWGNILYSSKDYIMSYPHLFYGPFIIIFLTIFSFNLIGKGLINYFEKDQKN
ncbi:ABC transporter permease [Candidatus Phytoplasma ziziphi]|uniref:ABC transporter permease n=1 Tax=Ziziphus jujuba witches'-broom phytoplasma TaxID=135727 RepID=A0A660HMA8_ZIZJU|nr:ABC transporter permease [Candidatus Phytoplasma ziziphi]AYJ01168.1 ABC transporter permease [Candidatus Phytoplasma ziziphi]